MSFLIGINSLDELRNNLRKDPIRNSSLIGFIDNNPITEILSEGESYVVKGISDRKWVYFSSEYLDEFKKLLIKIHYTDTTFASLEDWMIPLITTGKQLEWKLTTMRYFLPIDTAFPENRIETFSLSEKDAEYIRENSNYKQYLPVEYLKKRIAKSFSAGVINNNKLVAWAITHDDGAIGALHVLNEFRNKGYASEIVLNLAYKIRNSGQIPIAQIEEKNESAIRLFEKLGFVKDRRVTWLKLF